MEMLLITSTLIESTYQSFIVAVCTEPPTEKSYVSDGVVKLKDLNLSRSCTPPSIMPVAKLLEMGSDIIYHSPL